MNNDPEIKVTIHTVTSTSRGNPSILRSFSSPQPVYIEYPDIFNLILQNSLNAENLTENQSVVLEYKTTDSSTLTEKTCSICQDTMTGDVAELDCCHYFHKDCIDKWGKFKQECPNCRHEISYSLN